MISASSSSSARTGAAFRSRTYPSVRLPNPAVRAAASNASTAALSASYPVRLAPPPRRGSEKVPTPQYRSTICGRICGLSLFCGGAPSVLSAAARTAATSAVSASVLACRKAPGGGYNSCPPTDLSRCTAASAVASSSTGSSASGGWTASRTSPALPVSDAAAPVVNIASLSAGICCIGCTRISAPPLSILIWIVPVSPGIKQGAAHPASASVTSFSAGLRIPQLSSG